LREVSAPYRGFCFAYRVSLEGYWKRCRHDGGISLNKRLAMILTVGLLTAAAGVWTATQWQGKTVIGETWMLEGTLRYLDLEGGCWVLEDDTGQRYQLVGLPSSLLQNGVRLRLEVKKAERMMGKCQTGEFVRVLRVLQVQRPKLNRQGQKSTAKSPSFHPWEKWGECGTIDSNHFLNRQKPLICTISTESGG